MIGQMLFSCLQYPIWYLFVLLILYPLILAVYNVTLHPLSCLPGPICWRISRLAYMTSLWSGRSHRDLKRFHDLYGPVVRIAPNEISFADPSAWRDIYSNRGISAFPKSAVWHAAQSGRANAIINCLRREEHARMRKLLNPGFTTEAVKMQESIVQDYVDMFIQRLKEVSRGKEQVGTIVDIAKWFTFVSLDIIGDLTFGESFDCLRKNQMDWWVSLIFESLKVHVYVASLRHYGWATWLLERLIPEHAKERARIHWETVKEKTDKRLARHTSRPDFLALWQKAGKNVGDGLTLDEIYANSLTMTFAGGETVATALTGIINLLVKCPKQLAELTEEVRGKFQREDDISFAALKALPYLDAVLWESFRMCTPFPLGFIRLTPASGATVCGYWIPANTFVSINLQALFLGSERFHEAALFRPERWLSDAKRDPQSPFFDDFRDVVKPFGEGPRSCIGKQLALAEMKLILARLVWMFDLARANTTAGKLLWEDQRTFTLVEKRPFEISFTLRKSEQ